MSNWAKLQEQITGLPVAKRAKYGIHFKRPDGLIEASFVGKPCHYLDGAVWRAIDTKLIKLSDGWYGSPHSDVRINPDGRVSVTGSDYQQFTELPSAKTGAWDGDKLIRTFPGGEQHLIMKEDGFKEEIHVLKPTFPLEKFIAKTTGNLPSKYRAHPITAEDADGNSYTFTGDVAAFGKWLDKAVYPVVIDPDFAGGTGDGQIYAANATYNTAWENGTDGGINTTNRDLFVGQYIPADYRIYRSYLLFDTSSIGAGSTVTQNNLNLTVYVDASATDFDVQIVKKEWTEFPSGANIASEWVSIATADLDDAIFRNTNGVSTNTKYTSGNLSAAWVSKTGTTKYCLMSSRDRSKTAPTGNEYIRFYSANDATESYRPVLTVTYTAAGTFIPINMNAQMQSLTGGMRG